MSSGTAGEPDAEAIATAVRAVPVVAGLHGGPFGEVATYLPSRAVTGVRITEDTVAVHVSGYYPTPIEQIAAAVRTVAAPHTAGLPITVVVEDLAPPGETAPPPARGSAIHD